MSDCYLLTQKGIMPATYVGLTDSGLCEVTSPNGTAYTPAPCNVVSQDEGDFMLRQRRGEKLVALGYHVMHLRGDRYRVWHQRRHGDTGGYLVTLGTVPSCTCPDYQKRGTECKHLMGLPELLRCATVTKPTVRVMATTAIAPKSVFAVCKPSAGLAAMIARDGWS